jgi:hypothetical protein
LRSGFILFALGFFTLSPAPKAFAVNPPPDGGYPRGNTAEGQAALLSLTTGGNNTGVGFLSLRSNSTGTNNTGIGAGAFAGNTADNNTASGTRALFRNTSGTANTANGVVTLFSNTPGISTPFGEVPDSCYIGNISGALVSAPTARAVLVDADGKLGTFTIDASGNKTVPTPQGAKPQAMLNRKVEEQQATIAALKSTVAQQQKQMEIFATQLKEQAAQIQKVSAQVEIAKPAAGVAAHNP